MELLIELLKNKLTIMLVLLLMMGFRTFVSSNPWDISSESASSAKVFVDYDRGSDLVKNDVASSDPISGAGATVTVDQIMSSIFTDVNNINASYISLVATTDLDFATLGQKRTIIIRFRDAGGASSGEAQPLMEDGKFIGCEINASKDLLDGAEVLIRTMTHEIGHCLGLDHPQESTQSVMSYYSSQDITRLQLDDKMGIVFLYPVDSSAAKEEATFGMSCKRR